MAIDRIEYAMFNELETTNKRARHVSAVCPKFCYRISKSYYFVGTKVACIICHEIVVEATKQ